MSLVTFFSVIIFLLIIFQALQVYFFKKKQLAYGWIFVAFFWTTFVFLGYNFYLLFALNDNESSLDSKIITIEKGSTLNKIASQLYNEKLIDNRNHFLWSVSLLGVDHKIRAGKFKVTTSLSNYSLIKQLTSGEVVREKVTIVEGLTSRQIGALFAKHLDIDSTKFAELVTSSETAKKLGIEENSLEGYLFPDTYYFNWGITEIEIIELLVAEFKKNISSEILENTKSMNMSLHEVVTLASIIEGEAVHDKERPVISAVYHNRLKKGWKLQADPTIQYVIPDGPRRLLSRDLTIDSPYNTYKYKGLPPGPINNPGLMSIIAASKPSEDTYMYFVATGEGYHTFTNTQKEHLEAKKILDQNRRKERDKQRLKRN